MQYLLHALRGALIGMAELVPGISGGTVALIVGIYERALHNAAYLMRGSWRRAEWGFLTSVAFGMVAAVFGMSSLLHGFVTSQVSVSNAFFLGMVAVSITVPLTMIDKAALTKMSTWVSFAVAAIVIFCVTGFTSEPVSNPNLLVVFFAAALAVCALVLPGVSGSLILLTIGLYHPIIGAVSDRDIPTIAVFAAGALCGLAAFVKLLNYLLDAHRAPTLAAMAGFMFGSLRALWPWGEVQDASHGIIVATVMAGAALVGVIMYVSSAQAKAGKS